MRFDIRIFERFLRNRQANVAVTFGLLAIPLIFAVGMAVDYGNNARKWSQLNAAADAAALAAVTPAMLQQPDSVAQTAATNLFMAQASSIQNVVPGSLKPTIKIQTTTAGANRTATVSYTAQIYNIFGGILGQSAMTVTNTAQATSSAAAAVNFYVLADTSPSMAIPATTAGITTLQNATLGYWGASQGCAFACHEQNPAFDCLASPSASKSPCAYIQPTQANPGGIDTYALARQLGIILRIDNVKTAVQSLASMVDTLQSQNQTTYQTAIYTFDLNFNTITALTTPAKAAAAASNIQLYEMYDGHHPLQGVLGADDDTLGNAALSQMNSIIANPGNGSPNNPKAFLLFVTDGIEDDTNTTGLMDMSSCTAMKKRGIDIGVVYTTYYPIPTYWPYQQYVQPVQSQIGPNLQSCASNPSYYIEVNTDGDISKALTTILGNYVGSLAHLTQ